MGDEARLMLDFVVTWRHWGGGSAEDIFVRFGVAPEVFFQRVDTLIWAGVADAYDAEVVAQLIAICRTRTRRPSTRDGLEAVPAGEQGPGVRRAKIVCAIESASASEDQIRGLIEAGMDAARLNLGQGTHDDHRAAFDRVRSASQRTGRAVGIIAELQGARVIVGRSTDGATSWPRGALKRISVEGRTSVGQRPLEAYRRLARNARPGDVLCLAGEQMGLKVLHVEGGDIICSVVDGVTAPVPRGGAASTTHTLSEKDCADLEFAVRLGVDFIALPRVRHRSDLTAVHRVMDRIGRRIPLLAKVDVCSGDDGLEAVVRAFDAIMVTGPAAGRDGVSTRQARRRAIEIARVESKPVIVATEFFEPPSAAATATGTAHIGVIAAVDDGADAVTLTDDAVAASQSELEVRTIDHLIRATEAARGAEPVHEGVLSPAGTMAVRDLGRSSEAKALIALTRSADTVRRLARLYPALPLLAFVPDLAVCRQLSVSRGVEAFAVPPSADIAATVRYADDVLMSLPHFERGDLVFVFAVATKGASSPNPVRLHRIGAHR